MFAYNPARINVGSIAYQNQIEPVLVSSLYEIFQTNSKIDDSFLMNWFKTSLFNRQIKRLEEGGVRQYFFIDKMKETEIKLPSISEQNQISKLLQLVNKNLDLQQRKLELLSLIKKTIIKHLFKLKNSDSLNLKFKTSCSQWNSKKLGEIAKFINGRAFKQSELLNKGKYPVLRVGNFYTNDKWFYSDLNLNKNKYADKGDLLYTWSATFGPHIWKGPKVIFHYHIWKIDFDPSTVNKTFLFYFLEADKENLLTNSNGSTMIHITKSNMENKIINLPQFSIQQNIGTFLSNLDYLINQVKIKSKQLIQLKRFLLQNMFI
ncbi:type I restriction endonuclease subunit S [Lactobacillus sp. UMNPBX6]|nr:type I restriction endonuclease subunit S [Lactobacillus sp. UMNPBX14]PEH01855.1 type I restriction endonuclease subunit S [Lactobacillus sp. UMNPBX6]